jgi:hypothetical protein
MTRNHENYENEWCKIESYIYGDKRYIDVFIKTQISITQDSGCAYILNDPMASEIIETQICITNPFANKNNKYHPAYNKGDVNGANNIKSKKKASQGG